MPVATAPGDRPEDNQQDKPAGMTMVPVNSSNIKAIGYSPIECTLRIEFHTGAIYDYFSVPALTHKNLMAAESKGKFFHANIKGVYNYVPVN